MTPKSRSSNTCSISHTESGSYSWLRFSLWNTIAVVSSQFIPIWLSKAQDSKCKISALTEMWVICGISKLVSSANSNIILIKFDIGWRSLSMKLYKVGIRPEPCMILWVMKENDDELSPNLTFVTYRTEKWLSNSKQNAITWIFQVCLITHNVARIYYCDVCRFNIYINVHISITSLYKSLVKTELSLGWGGSGPAILLERRIASLWNSSKMTMMKVFSLFLTSTLVWSQSVLALILLDCVS